MRRVSFPVQQTAGSFWNASTAHQSVLRLKQTSMCHSRRRTVQAPSWRGLHITYSKDNAQFQPDLVAARSPSF